MKIVNILFSILNKPFKTDIIARRNISHYSSFTGSMTTISDLFLNCKFTPFPEKNGNCVHFFSILNKPFKTDLIARRNILHYFSFTRSMTMISDSFLNCKFTPFPERNENCEHFLFDFEQTI